MEKKVIPFPIVIVRWVDSISNTGWESVSSATDIHPGNAMSVGFLVDEGLDYITIAQNYIGDKGQEQMCGVMSIPKGAIKSCDDITPDIKNLSFRILAEEKDEENN